MYLSLRHDSIRRQSYIGKIFLFMRDKTFIMENISVYGYSQGRKLFNQLQYTKCVFSLIFGFYYGAIYKNRLTHAINANINLIIKFALRQF